MKLRNPLYVPADSGRKVTKALASGADAVILDLEDSIAPSAKETARAGAVAAMQVCDCSRVIVRINSPETRWYLSDLAAIVPYGPAAILLPKCTGAHDLRRLTYQLDVLETAAGIALGSIRVLVIATETVASVQSMRYAGVSPRLIGLCFGAEDLASDLGIQARGVNKTYPASIVAVRANLLLAAAEAGVPAIDTPWPEPKDLQGLELEARASAFDGFSGKLCIHPDQLVSVAGIFTPLVERIEWATAVREAFAANPNAGVLSIDGKMVDLAHLKLAQRILSAIEK